MKILKMTDVKAQEIYKVVAIDSQADQNALSVGDVVYVIRVCDDNAVFINLFRDKKYIGSRRIKPTTIEHVTLVDRVGKKFSERIVAFCNSFLFSEHNARQSFIPNTIAEDGGFLDLNSDARVIDKKIRERNEQLVKDFN
jgi:hypothetical protein